MALTALSAVLARRLSIPTRTKCRNWVAVGGGDVLIGSEKGDANDRSHEFMNDNEKRINDVSMREGSHLAILLQVVVVACHVELK